MSTAELHLNLTRSSIVIDGHDISNHVRSINLSATPGRLPRLEIELVVMDVTALGEQTTVRIDPGTVELLQRSGWTAPEGDPTVLWPRTTDTEEK